MRSVTMCAGQARMGVRMRTACNMALLGFVVALAGCSGSQGERILMKGCKEGGVSDKDCQCATQEVGKRYDLKNLQEFMNDRAIPMQTLQMDFVKALAMCTARPGSEVR